MTNAFPEPQTDSEQQASAPDSSELEPEQKVGLLDRLRPKRAQEELDLTTAAHVNLLPDAVRLAELVRRAQMIALGFILGALLLLFALWVLARTEIANAETELAEAEAINAQLAAEIARYSDVPRVFQAADNAELALQEAMGPEIRWSWVLNDLSLTTPEGVALSSMTSRLNSGSFASGGGGGPIDTSRGVGSLDYTGQALQYTLVDTWLASLDGNDAYLPPALLNSAARDGEGGLIAFNTQALLAPGTLSQRYTVGDPEASGQQPAPAPDSGAGGAEGEGSVPDDPTDSVDPGTEEQPGGES